MAVGAGTALGAQLRAVPAVRTFSLTSHWVLIRERISVGTTETGSWGHLQALRTHVGPNLELRSVGPGEAGREGTWIPAALWL